MSTIGPMLRMTERRLANAGIGDARIEADLVWMTALDIDRAELYAHLQDTPSPKQAYDAESLLQRRLNHEPAAYIMGKREFYGLELTVAPGVLIPRPDTETLVEEALGIAARLGRDALTIADVGCGSGAIAIALATSLPGAEVYAIDISPRALELAAINAERHEVSQRLHFLQGDLLAPLTGPVDLITANLPYVMSEEIPTLDPEVRLHEPLEALDGGDDGLDIIRQLLADASAHLTDGGALLLEMDPRQIASATRSAEASFPKASIRVIQDLAHRNRVLVLETSKGETS